MKSIWLHFQELDQSQLFFFGLPHGNHANLFFIQSWYSILSTYIYWYTLFYIVTEFIRKAWYAPNQTECPRSWCNEASSVCFHISNLFLFSLLRKWTWYNLHHGNVFQSLIHASTRSFAYIFHWEALETLVMCSALPCTNCVTQSADIIILWLMLWILSAFLLEII